jgi:hypothetical protein
VGTGQQTTNYVPPPQDPAGQPSSSTNQSAGNTFSSPVGTLTRVAGSGYIDEDDGPFAYYQTVDAAGNTKIYVLPEYNQNGVNTPNTDYMSANSDPVSTVSNPNANVDQNSNYPVADDGKYLGDQNTTYGQGPGEVGAPEQPSTDLAPGENYGSDSGYTFDFDFDFGFGCFLFGTKITMADGSFKNIEDLKIGDELKTFAIPGVPDSDNPDDWYSKDKWSIDSAEYFTYTTTKVTQLKTGPYNEHYKINNKYKVTWEHYILVKRDSVWQFLQTQDLRNGDFFLGENKEEIEIFNIERVNGWISTVTLDVEGQDMYFADGILAHNFYSYK